MDAIIGFDTTEENTKEGIISWNSGPDPLGS
jgi:hypothetical protein